MLQPVLLYALASELDRAMRCIGSILILAPFLILCLLAASLDIPLDDLSSFRILQHRVLQHRANPPLFVRLRIHTAPPLSKNKHIQTPRPMYIPLYLGRSDVTATSVASETIKEIDNKNKHSGAYSFELYVSAC